MEKKNGRFWESNSFISLFSWLFSVAATALFAFSAAMKFTGGQQVIDGLAHLGWAPGSLHLLGAIELSCIALYLYPRTAVLGAILFTGYLGGAMATHLRLNENVLLHIALGFALWGALYLREPRLRTLLPLVHRSKTSP